MGEKFKLKSKTAEVSTEEVTQEIQDYITFIDKCQEAEKNAKSGVPTAPDFIVRQVHAAQKKREQQKERDDEDRELRAMEKQARQNALKNGDPPENPPKS